MKTIPKKYMWKGSYKSGAIRTFSSIRKELNNKQLNEIECPYCGNKNLRIAYYKDYADMSQYGITCDSCDWTLPRSISDYGEIIILLRDWLEAYHLLGKPKDRIKEDLTLEFYPEGEFREAIRNSRENY